MEQPRKRPRSTLLLVVASSVITASLLAMGFMAWQLTKKSSGGGTPDGTAKQTIQRVTEEVGKMLLLPNGETPTVAKITDPEKVKDQSFFKDVKAGDYLIIYEDSEMAILYREAINKLIKVGSVTVNLKQSQQAPLTPAIEQ